MKTSEQSQWRRSDVFIVNFEHISHLVLVFLLLTLNMQLPARKITNITDHFRGYKIVKSFKKN